MLAQMRTPGSPALSHHCAVAIDDRYMLLIGGWNGRLRTPDVWAYDAQEDRWLPMKTSGFPEGGGLSSHTATMLSSTEVCKGGRGGREVGWRGGRSLGGGHGSVLESTL